MIHALELTGRQVLTIDEGAAAGKVNGVLVNSVTGEVAALVVILNDTFESPRAVPVALVQGVGDDAVIIENSSALIEFAQSPELKAMGRLDSQIRGLPVIPQWEVAGARRRPHPQHRHRPRRGLRCGARARRDPRHARGETGGYHRPRRDNRRRRREAGRFPGRRGR